MSGKTGNGLHTRSADRSRTMVVEGRAGKAANSYDPKTRTCEIMISTGAAVKRRDMWSGEEWEEILEVSERAVRLGRLNQGAPLLDAHDYHSGMDAMLGAILPGTARIEGGKLIAVAKLSRSAKGERIAQDLEDGIPISVSTGYKTYKETKDSSGTTEKRIATDWEPLEVSIAPIPAEAGAAFRAEHIQRTRSSTTEEVNMTPEEKERLRLAEEAKKRTEEEAKKRADEDAKKRADDEAAKKKEEEDAAKKKEEEAKRTADADAIRNRSGGGLSEADVQKRADEISRKRQEDTVEIFAIGREAGLELKLIEDAVKRGETVDNFRKIAFTALANKTKDGVSGTHVDVVRDEAEGMRQAKEEAMVIRILSSRREPAIKSQDQAEWAKRNGKIDVVGRSLQVANGNEKPTVERAAQYLSYTWAELAAEAIGHKGNIRSIAQANEIIRRAFHTTSDFPILFENVMNKVLLARYTLALPTYRQLATEKQFQDFRAHNMYRTGDFPTMEEITETGEIKAGTAGESKELVSVKAYGKQFRISRVALVNDDMGALDQILASAGQMVLTFENTTFFNMMLSNPTLLTDSKAVWEATRTPANLVLGGHPTVDTVSVGRKAMRQQKSLDGNFLNIAPAILLSGPAQETVVDQLLTTITPALVSSVNPFSGKLRPVSDANITDTSWMLFAEPSQLPNFVYGWLQGGYGPRIRNDEPFGVQGVAMSIEHDFGVGAIDFRGTFKNDGSSG